MSRSGARWVSISARVLLAAPIVTVVLLGCSRTSSETTGPLFTGDVAGPCSESADAVRFEVTSTGDVPTKQVQDAARRFLVGRPTVFNTYECSATIDVLERVVVVAVPSEGADVVTAPRLEFRQVATVFPPGATPGQPTEGQSLFSDSEGSQYLVEPASEPTPRVAKANAKISAQTGMAVVELRFEAGDASAAFDRIAAAALSRQLAIVVDGTVMSAPTVNSERFRGLVEISGDFTKDEAETIAEALSTTESDLVFTRIGSSS